jgi:tetratricopeptide (TPR) repeat protein
MSTEATVLLVAAETPPEGLVEAIEAAGLYVEVTSPQEFPSALPVATPDVVVHLGASQAIVTAALLRPADETELPIPLVLLGARTEVETLRRLDRRVVRAVLALDIPKKLIVDRIVALASAVSESGDDTDEGSGGGLRRTSSIPPALTPEDKIRAWVQSSRPPVITEMDEADEHLANFGDESHDFAPYVDVTPPSLEPDVLSDFPGEPETEVAGSPPSLEEIAPESDSERETLIFEPDDEDGRPTVVVDEEGTRPTVQFALPREPEPPEADIDSSLIPSAEVSTATAVQDRVEPTIPPSQRKMPERGSKWGARTLLIGALVLGAFGFLLLKPKRDGETPTGAIPLPVAPTSNALAPQALAPDAPAPNTQARDALEKEPSPAPITASAQEELSPPKPDELWVVQENPGVQSCEVLVPDRKDLRLGDTDQSSRLWKRARGLLLVGDVNAALVALCQASLVVPNGLVTEALIEHLLSLRAPRTALPFVARARAERPNRPRTLELAGDVECQLGHVPEARELWFQALGLKSPSDATLRQVSRQITAQAASVRKGGQVGLAERLYRRAAILDDQNTEAWRGLADVAREQGPADKVAMFEKHASKR